MIETRHAASGRWVRTGRTPISATPLPGVPAGFAVPVLNEQFDTGRLNGSIWNPYDNSTYGAPSRVQRYMAANVMVGAGSAGSTGGTSLKLLSKREAIGGNAFTAGMLDTKGVGFYLPRYGRFETRVKVPHGQGIWPAWWLTAKNNGANTVEVDILEYFHSQIPGHLISTLHRADLTGTLKTNVSKNNGGVFFEAPTYAPAWHIVAIEITPVSGDPDSPADSVRFKAYVDGTLYWDYTDTQARWWTTNGGDRDNFYNMYVQGSQIDGAFVGSPDDPLGYGHQLNGGAGGCLISGTAPNSCSITYRGYNVQRAGAPGPTATFSDPATTFELDYVKVWRYTG